MTIRNPDADPPCAFCNLARDFHPGLAVNLDSFNLLVADSRTNAKEPAALYRLSCTNIGTPTEPHPDWLLNFARRGLVLYSILDLWC